MKKLIIVLFAFLLITACTPEEDIDYGVGTQDDTDDTSSSTTTEDTEEETGRFSLDDFQYGAESIVYYTGTANENYQIMNSLLNDYFSEEEDSAYSQDYSFKVARVYYGDMSILYLYDLHAAVSLSYEEISEDLYNGDLTSTTIADSAQNSAILSEPRKIGQIDADGEVYFTIQPKYESFSNDCVKTTTYPDGTTDSSTSTSCDYSGIGIGGGSDEQCQPATNDNALTNPSSCKLYISGDGSTSGTFVDSNYQSDETTHNTQIRTFTWALTPNEPIEEPIYLQ